MWWIAAGFNISDMSVVAGEFPLSSSWSQITRGQTNIKIFTVHLLLLNIKPGLFASSHSPPTHLYLSQFAHLRGMCFDGLKKQLSCDTQVQVLLVDPASEPGVLWGTIPSWSKVTLVLNTLLGSSRWPTRWCCRWPPQLHLTNWEGLTAPWRDSSPHIPDSNSNRDPSHREAGAWPRVPLPHQQLLEVLWKRLFLGMAITGCRIEKPSKPICLESSFHLLLLKNTN